MIRFYEQRIFPETGGKKEMFGFPMKSAVNLVQILNVTNDAFNRKKRFFLYWFNGSLLEWYGGLPQHTFNLKRQSLCPTPSDPTIKQTISSKNCHSGGVGLTAPRRGENGLVNPAKQYYEPTLSLLW